MVTMSPFLRSNGLTLGTAHCSDMVRRLSEKELEPAFSVVFPMAGVYVRHVEGEHVVATPAVALFSNREEVQKVGHPAGGADRCVYVSLSPEMAEPFLDPRTHRFPYRSAVTTPQIDLEMRLLERRAAAGSLTPLEAEGSLLGILRALSPQVSSRRRHVRQHAVLIEEAKEYLAAHLSRDCGLGELARSVGCSPHHLSRLFRSITGTTISAHRTQLRLRFAISRILEGADDLARVAVDAGFYDHSHMTRTMRRHLGLTPSAMRSMGSSRPEGGRTGRRGEV